MKDIFLQEKPKGLDVHFFSGCCSDAEGMGNGSDMWNTNWGVPSSSWMDVRVIGGDVEVSCLADTNL